MLYYNVTFSRGRCAFCPWLRLLLAKVLLGAMDRVLYLAAGHAALGSVDEVMTGEVLSRLCQTPIEVLRVGGRVVVVSAHGEVDTNAHHHHP